LGNICRSPTAAAIFADRVRGEGFEKRITAESAGTGAWHVGEGADPRAVAAARRHGYDLSTHSARQVVRSDFASFDYVLAMDDDNLESLLGMAPARCRARVSLLLDYADDTSVREVPDPYYGGGSGFDRVITLLEKATAGLFDHIVENHFS